MHSNISIEMFVESFHSSKLVKRNKNKYAGPVQKRWSEVKCDRDAVRGCQTNRAYCTTCRKWRSFIQTSG